MSDVLPTETPLPEEQPPGELVSEPTDALPAAVLGAAPTAVPDPAPATVLDAAPADVPEHVGPVPPISRRQLLKIGAAAAPCLLGGTAIYELLSTVSRTPPAAIDPIVARYDAAAHRWAFVVDTAACIGCGQCVVACKQENGVPTDGEHTRTWVERRILASDGTVHVDSPEAGVAGFADAPAPIPAVDIRASRFVPRLCMQCEQSPCTTVCPVGATYRAADGVILIDEVRCIGCGYCVVACPYGARYLVPAGERTPAGVAGVADKCTFCYHRITRGRQPACVEICPVGARRFGDLNDTRSVVSLALRDQPSRVLRPEMGTRPRVHYLGLEEGLA